METIRYQLDDGIATVTFDDPAAPVNTMREQWHRDFADLAARLHADRDKLRGVVLTSAKKTFFAGADLKGVLRLTPGDSTAIFQRLEALKQSLRTIETLGRPVVALVGGTALGGGWELALVAHARFALDDPKIKLGLPEVTLGLIPGATGITKTTRLLGLAAAQPYLLEGRLMSPREAHEIGLVDALATNLDELHRLAMDYIVAHPDAMQPWDRKEYRMPGGGPSSPSVARAIAAAPAVLFSKTRGLYPAAQAILETMVEGASVDYDTATRIESRKLARLMTGQNARNMITAFFFDLNAIRSGRFRPAVEERWGPRKVGILGAGMMGGGIAYANASRGIASVLRDVSLEKAEAGRAYTKKVTDRQVARGHLAAEAQEEMLARIRATIDLGELEGCDLIIEAVYENRELKARVTGEAEPLLAPDGIFASNTSILPISELAEASGHPERFVGLHFFSPVDRMKLVEIIRGRHTDERTIARAFDYVLALGKTPIIVNDSRGFFTSRVFGTYVMEGAAMVGEGLPARLVENGALAAGMPVGPLAVLDETSLTLSVDVLDQARAAYAAEGLAFEPSPGQLLVERMVKELGRYGRAGGGGFYDYPAGEPKRLWPELERLFERPLPAEASSLLPSIRDRLLYRQAIETARCLAEGVLTSTSEANIGSIFGIGFPAWTGGAMQFIYAEGIERFLERSAELAREHGTGFELAENVVETIHANHPTRAFS